MKTFKFHVNIIQNDSVICELQFERKAPDEARARMLAGMYIYRLDFPAESTFSIAWAEEVEEELQEINTGLYKQIDSAGFICWENPLYDIDEAVRLKMEAIEEYRNA